MGKVFGGALAFLDSFIKGVNGFLHNYKLA